ncbi:MULTISPECIES: AmiS/UreI family transporter [Mycolicibacterium]|uniref:AmiS/UreI family transporter n=1 Tax=Mycolicibacterium TaxID=1866885 RepID=UPI001F404E99|nr:MULTISPECIES: AmiS/UreI family transporter [Mycolicibacterium]MCW1820613.1 hypothetical protein [Mycolicibacterium senegalense]
MGVALFVNGLVSVGLVSGRGAAPINLFVGAAQVVLPTLVLVQSDGDPGIINATWPSYLFGFTYLWFGFIQIFDIDPRGFGWYSTFVAAIAAYYAIKSLGTDPVFAVIWATWSIMWTLYLRALGARRHQGRPDRSWALHRLVPDPARHSDLHRVGDPAVERNLADIACGRRGRAAGAAGGHCAVPGVGASQCQPRGRTYRVIRP